MDMLGNVIAGVAGGLINCFLDGSEKAPNEKFAEGVVKAFDPQCLIGRNSSMSLDSINVTENKAECVLSVPDRTAQAYSRLFGQNQPTFPCGKSAFPIGCGQNPCANDLSASSGELSQNQVAEKVTVNVKERREGTLCDSSSKRTRQTSNTSPKERRDQIICKQGRRYLKVTEGLNVEFKASILFSPKNDGVSDGQLYVIAREMAAFMNTKGGVMYFGVRDDGEIIGIERDLPFLSSAHINGLFVHDCGYSFAA